MISHDHDSTLDGPVLDLVGTAFADVHLDRDASDVIGRGRRSRRRRRAMPALATAGILAVSLSLAAMTQDSASSEHNLGYNGAVVNVDEAGFSVHTDAKTDDVTVSITDELFNAKLLRETLAKAGIPAIVRVDTTAPACSWQGAKALDPSKVISTRFNSDTESVVTVIHPNAMPPGSVVGFEIYAGGGAISIDGSRSKLRLGKTVGMALLSNMPTGCTQ